LRSRTRTKTIRLHWQTLTGSSLLTTRSLLQTQTKSSFASRQPPSCPSISLIVAESSLTVIRPPHRRWFLSIDASSPDLVERQKPAFRRESYVPYDQNEIEYILENLDLWTIIRRWKEWERDVNNNNNNGRITERCKYPYAGPGSFGRQSTRRDAMIGSETRVCPRLETEIPQS